MDGPFIYDKYVTGKNFIGRREDCNILSNLLTQGEHIVMYAPPKSGIMSVVQQTMFNMRIRGGQFSVGQVSIHNIRETGELLCRIGSQMIRSVASTPDEYEKAVSDHLKGTHFRFDAQGYRETDRILSLSDTPDENDAVALFNLPQGLAVQNDRRVIIIIEEFQNILRCEEGEKILKTMEKVFSSLRKDGAPMCNYIFTGSMYNAMKEIFQRRHFFHRLVEEVPLRKVDDKEIVDYIVKGFLTGGKVIDRELVLGASKLLKANLWYLNHFMAICDSLSKGYMTESTLIEGLGILTSIHEPRFMATMNDLTTFQVNLLKAILDGNDKFSASDTIRKYSLNSSANVKRLKDALEKKEIVSFDEMEKAEILDPLFEYWVRKVYFEMG